ncbi:MAG: ATP-binding protein [Candidatus Symbiobacter sp.]|nr:ATP-binding protein [Candidatus Symbiobacter sp.]
MPKADHVLSLIRSHAANDQASFQRVVEAIIADERAINHHVYADRLSRALQSVAAKPAMTSQQLNGMNGGREAILEISPRVRLDDLVLTPTAQSEAENLIEEHQRANLLRAHGYEPRHRVLLSGPPGNGKTSFAEAIAEALSLPLFVVRYDALINSFLGETNTRLRKLIDYVKTQKCVLFFDEFDSVGKERGDTHETGEIKRVVSFLLLQLDQLPSYVITIAATNHAELLDRAVWRRFQIRINFPAPDLGQMAVFIDRILSSWEDKPKLSAEKLAQNIGAESYAEILVFCQNVRRRQMLSLGGLGVDQVIKSELSLWHERVKPLNMDETNGRGNHQKTIAAPVRKRSRGKGEKNGISTAA